MEPPFTIVLLPEVADGVALPDLEGSVGKPSEPGVWTDGIGMEFDDPDPDAAESFKAVFASTSLSDRFFDDFGFLLT